MKFVFIVALALSCLSGCATYQAVLNGYETTALVTVQAADDNAIRIWTVAACGTPLSAVIRHPDIVPALSLLCLPGPSALKMLAPISAPLPLAGAK